MSPWTYLGTLTLVTGLNFAVGACNERGTSLLPEAVAAATISEAPGLIRQYGDPIRLGNARARTYLLLDEHQGVPVEVGIAMDEEALEGLPAPVDVPAGHHEHSETYILPMPARNPTPYRFVMLNWNARGHGDPYSAPHFDFHFYRIPLAEREAIDPADPDWAVKAAKFPDPAQLPVGYRSSHELMKMTPAEATVPQMGLHWLDLASPELPPRSEPFTATFIVGTWDGRVIFDEPMITRDFLLARREAGDTFAAAVPTVERRAPAGFYPDGYTVGYYGGAKEYRVALTGLAWRDQSRP